MDDEVTRADGCVSPPKPAEAVPLRIGIVTLFPELMAQFSETSVIGRGQRAGLLRFHFEDLRKHGVGRYQSVDDTPYGGGAGMVLRVDCVVAAMEAAEQALGAAQRPLRLLMSPQGQPFNQARAMQLARSGAITLVCGRYEGFDSRVSDFVDGEISLGDFVLAGGEIAAMAVAEAAARLVPGVLGNGESTNLESFSPTTGGLLEFPQFTRPLSFRGKEVPEILRGGNHGAIEAWRQQQAVERTEMLRPELLTAGRERSSGEAPVLKQRSCDADEGRAERSGLGDGSESLA